ncbi:MAG: hypothetical protein Q9160_005202 [Pyrenula sp. 1 TL-2023]
MAIINTTVAKSQNVKDAALNLNAKAFEVRRTLAAVWDLKPTGTQPPPPAETISLDMKNSGGESVVGGDERVRVPDQDIAPGGKPDIFVTAGHCSYDWSHKMGRATEVKAYIGYRGNQSTNNADVQFSRVKRIVTTEGWVKTKGMKSFDVSFMQLDKPFTGITPIQYAETPAKDSLTIGVVGYPADLFDRQTGEHGAYMHEMFLPTQYDLATQTDTMLEYQIDTYGGNSGSPVLRKSDLVSIGAHVYGGEVNSASVIGKYGNPYNDYLAAFDLLVPNDGLNLIPVTGNAAIAAPVPAGYGSTVQNNAAVTGPLVCDVCKSRPVGQHHSVSAQSTSTARRAITHAQSQTPSQAAPSRPQAILHVTSSTQQHSVAFPSKATLSKDHVPTADEEGFIDVLKTVASVGAPLLGKALNVALPVALGPIGGPVGALAGFALNAASKLAAESYGPESALDAPNLHEGSMERAILAEAALMTLQSKEFSVQVEESIFTDMKDSVMKVLPTIRKAAPHVMGAMMEPALRVALDSLHQYNAKAVGGAESFEVPSNEPFKPAALYSPAIDEPVEHRAEAFLANLQTALTKNLQESATGDGDSEEAWTDVLKAGVRLAGKGVLAAAKHGLPILLQGLAAPHGGAESALDEGPTSTSTSHAFSADALAQRAVVAEAALQAVMNLPPETLHEEGFFDFIGEAVKKIAPIALKVAPSVAGAIHPVVGNIVKGVLGQESYMGGSNLTAAPGERLRPEPRKIAKKTSLAAIRDRQTNGSGANSQYTDRQRRYEQGVGLRNQIGLAY